MKYALNLAEDGRILSVTFEKYAPKDAELVEDFPEGDLHEYRYVGNRFVHDPLPVVEVEENPSVNDVLNTLLGVTV